MASLPRLRRALLPALGVLTAVVMLAALLSAWTMHRPFPAVDGELRLPVLDAEAAVYRDAHGVPRIYADTAADLFRAQGFVHAQDRFWQMDLNRRTTAGRLAELFGPDQVETDVYLRTLGWRHVAEQEYALLEPQTRGYLDAYAEGVNAYLDEREDAQMGLEYAVLGLVGGDHGIEEWSPYDSLAWLKAMAWDLRGNMRQEIDRARLLASGLSREEVEELYPAYPEEEHPPVLPTGTVEDGAFTAEGTASEADASPAPGPEAAEVLTAVGDGLDRLPAALGDASPGVGSNSWVVSGEHTESGLPLLANDPHLGAQLPSVWHQVGLHCTEVDADCPFDTTGFGFAGLPGVVIGRNADIAWGFTNLGADVTDLYLERLDEEENAAIVDGEPEPLTTRTETIEVAGGEPEEITVRATRHGPLLSDAALAADLHAIGENAPVAEDGSPAGAARESGYGVALSWTALEPGTTADAIFLLNRAADFADFREAARSFEVPAQNLVYADTAGTIGYQAPGRIPVRGAGDGRWPAPGWDSAYDWQGYLPFEELPSVRDPDSGIIVTANHAVAGADYPHPLTEDWDYGYRARRISDLLTEAADGGPVDVSDMLAVQLDAQDPAAPGIVEHLMAVPVGGDAEQARALLEGWDFQMDADSAAAAFYAATWRHLLLDLFGGPEGDRPLPDASRGRLLVSRLLEDPGAPWWDGTETGGRDGALSTAMENAAGELAERLGPEPKDWRWGELHTLTLEHPSFGDSGIAALERVFNADPVQTSGGSSIVNATGWDPGEGYAVTSVPSMRMVVDLAESGASRWIDLTGVSGHTFHPHHRNQAEMWARGETLAWPFARSAVEEAAEHRLALLPEEH